MDIHASEKHYLGQGWSFPLGVDGAGRISMSRGGKDIEQSIMIILGTSKGERVMRPEFGSSIHDYVFAPNNASTHGLLAYHVRDALSFWEPRIEVDEVDVRPDDDNLNRVLINILYTVKSTNDNRNLVYPYYLIPLEE